MKYGYARVSSEEQSLDIQIDALEKAGCELVRGEKVSGTSREGRQELENLLQFLRKGDALVITRIDRLARSLGDLSDIVQELEAKGVSLIATEQPIDTSSAMGRMFVSLLGVFAQFETELRRERQLEGIAKAKKEGVYKGRKADWDRIEQVFNLKRQGVANTEIGKRLGISRSYVWKVLRHQEDMIFQ
ncbi:recombinase family protein [Acetobacter fallax]|uniref:Recombinase family protein n=1 Tax=Acetobacter fallax TaxID=1737473 RepID=A0ABX0KDC3_9PROT|nr:recombinase family protein [Acetobacter fallax]NHO34444.1 recombinase family protein [Acetobacter fallax]NHO38006.1 recombinase family protein [Acetobacter fallax]